MKLSLTQENLARALAVTGRAISNRSSLPILSNVLLTAEKNRLRLSATNLEIGVHYWIGAKVEQEGTLTVPAPSRCCSLNCICYSRHLLLLTP